MRTYHQENRKCKVCGVIFMGRKDAEYCSGRCRMYSSRHPQELRTLYPFPQRFLGPDVPDIEHIQAGEE